MLKKVSIDLEIRLLALISDTNRLHSRRNPQHKAAGLDNKPGEMDNYQRQPAIACF
jgi:hypothetical protein